MILGLSDILGVIAPHVCKRCGREGSTLCDNCINDIMAARRPRCVYCGAKCKYNNLCSNCHQKHSEFDDFYYISMRTGALKRLVGDYKYFSEVASCRPIACLASQTLKTMPLPDNLVIIPITTVPAHVRERGFDHMELVAKILARQLSAAHECSNIHSETHYLVRKDNSAQHELTSAERQTKIKSSLALNKNCLADHPMPKNVLILDDIFTTGATMSWAAQLIRQAGAKKIIGLTILRQPKP